MELQLHVLLEALAAHVPAALGYVRFTSAVGMYQSHDDALAAELTNYLRPLIV